MIFKKNNVYYYKCDIHQYNIILLHRSYFIYNKYIQLLVHTFLRSLKKRYNNATQLHQYITFFLKGTIYLFGDEVVFKVFHHTKGPETFDSNNFQ